MRTLTPSHIAQDASLPLSPAADSVRFARGRVVHRLLQYLPDIPPSQRTKAIKQYLQRYGAAVPQAEHAKLQAEVLAVLEHPQFAPVFSTGSAAEVPLSGIIPHEGGPPLVISGQVDRLCVSEKGVWVIDYKTQREAPRIEADIPLAYLRQMASYAALIERIYPGRPVFCALLWTSVPLLMPLDTARLRREVPWA